jgi:hypothetical protein
MKAKALLGDIKTENDDNEYKYVSVPPIITFPNHNRFNQSLWSEDPDMKLLRSKLAHAGFMESWNKCVTLYIQGLWSKCVDELEKFQDSFVIANRCRDGPCDFLIDLIKSSSTDGTIIDDLNHMSFRRLPH